MGKITLIELTAGDTQAIGARILSSIAREKGFDRTLIFMCGDDQFRKPSSNAAVQYRRKAVDQLLELTEGSDLVGISFLTNYYERAVQLTETIGTKLNIPVIWGGIHATARPVEALRHADMVCIGEGENCFAELLEKMKGEDLHKEINGIWFRDNGDLIRNPLRPLEQNLDKFPFQDYDLEGQYFFDKLKGDIVSFTYDDFRQLALYGYNIMMTRGCPNTCAFCYNSTWREMFRGQKYLRSRSVKNTVDELALMRTEFPFLDSVNFADDDFFSKSRETLKEFGVQYSSRVGIPFWAQVTPLTMDAEKVEEMIFCGLRGISMGVQTASSKISSIYKRPSNINDKIIRAAHIFHHFHKKYGNQGMRPAQYDFILDSYWEEEDEAYENIELLLNFPRPFGLHLASLVPYPGTKIYEKVIEENLIRDELTEVYRRPFMDTGYSVLNATFPNLLMIYFEYLPNTIIELLIRKKMRKLLSKTVPKSVVVVFFRMRAFIDRFTQLRKRIKAGDLVRIKAVFRRAIKEKLNLDRFA